MRPNGEGSSATRLIDGVDLMVAPAGMVAARMSPHEARMVVGPGAGELIPHRHVHPDLPVVPRILAHQLPCVRQLSELVGFSGGRSACDRPWVVWVPAVRRLPAVDRSELLPPTQRRYDAGMPLLRAVVLPGLGAIVVLAAAGRAIRLLGGDDPREDKAVRALQDAFGHRSGDGDAAVATTPAGRTEPCKPVDHVTGPLSWYSGVPQTIANGAIWCGITWVLTRDRHSAVAPAAVLALETACFVASAALVGRPRPERVWRPEQPHATSSFPSGHTAAAFALHGTLADLLDSHGARGARLLGPLLRYGIPGAIAFSRVYRGQHHISDTVAGAMLGWWSAAVVRRELISP